MSGKGHRAWLLLLLLLPGLALAAGVRAHQERGPGAAAQETYQVQVTPELARRGRRVFQQHCVLCHRTRSTRTKVGPGLKGLFARRLTPVMKHPVNDAAIRDHIHQGGKKMPAFPDIKGPDMDALIAYLKTL